MRGRILHPALGYPTGSRMVDRDRDVPPPGFGEACASIARAVALAAPLARAGPRPHRRRRGGAGPGRDLPRRPGRRPRRLPLGARPAARQRRAAGAVARGDGAAGPHAAALDAPPATIPPEGVKLEDLERDLIKRAMAQARDNKSDAARLLGLGRSQLYSRLE